QESIGLQSITDGEFRRDFWHMDFIHGFDGIDLTVNKFATFHATDEQPPLFKYVGKVRRTKPSMLDHFKYLKSLVAKGTPKFTMPSPAMAHARSERESLHKTYADLYKAGCRYLQIDDTTIAMWGDPKVQDQFKAQGEDPKKDAAMYAKAVNE